MYMTTCNKKNSAFNIVPVSEGRVVFGNRDGQVYLLDEQLQVYSHLPTDDIPFTEIARILATKQFIILLYYIGTIKLYSYDFDKVIQTYHIENTGNFKVITDGCLYSKHEILLSTFYFNLSALVLFNFDSNTTSLVAMNIEPPTLLSCGWQNVCMIYNKPEMEIQRFDKQTWTWQRLPLRIRNKVDLKSFKEGSLSMTDYGSILIVVPKISSIIEYGSNGEFLQHLATLTEFGTAVSLAFRKPYLWVLFLTNGNVSLVKYKILPVGQN